MPTLKKSGFLCKEIDTWVNKIRSENSKLFELADDTNKLSQKTMFELDAHSQNSQEVIVASLYMRAVSTYQGVLILSERGMISQARILTRALLEIIFTLCSVSKKKELIKTYIDEDKKVRLRVLEKLRKLNNGDYPEDVNIAEIQEMERELREDVKNGNIKIRKTEEWAKDAGLSSWYLSAYALLSDTVHIKISDLQNQIVVNENDEIKEFKWGPDDSGLSEILMTCIEGMCITISDTNMFFHQQKNEVISSLRERLHALV